MNRAEIKQLAKEMLAGNYFTMIFIMFSIVIICAMCGLIPIIGVFISAIVAAPLGIGNLKAYINLAKGKKVDVGEIFEHFDITFRVVWLNILVSVFITLWSLLFFIPGFVKSLSYSAAPYILAVNPDITANEAIARSMRLMNGHKMELFILQISFFFWHVLTAITFGIAGLYVGPYVNATTTNFYLKIGLEDVANEEIVIE